MITKKDISKGSVSNAHISKSAEIDPSKLKGDKAGSILIADREGKYVARKVRGDASLLPSGEFRVEGKVTQEDVRNAGGIIGRLGTGASAVPQRDGSGNLKAEQVTLVNGSSLPDASGGELVQVNNRFYLHNGTEWDEVVTNESFGNSAHQIFDNKTFDGGQFST